MKAQSSQTQQPFPWHPATGVWIRPFEVTGIKTHQNIEIPMKGVIPGETYKVRLQKTGKKQYRIVKIKRLSSQNYRQKVMCPHFYQCGGCSWLHVAYEKTLQWKKDAVSELARSFTIPVENITSVIGMDEPLPYRYRAIFPVREQNKEIVVGLYAANSHRVVPLETCLVVPPDFVEILKLIRFWMLDEKISALNDESGEGIIREIILQRQYRGPQILVTLVATRKAIQNEQHLIDKLSGSFPLAGINVMINSIPGNTILGTDIYNIFGDAELEDEIEGLKIKREPGAFFQANIRVALQAFATIRRHLEAAQIKYALEFFGGQGIISAIAGKKLDAVWVLEKSLDAISAGKWLAEINGLSHMRFMAADLKHDVSLHEMIDKKKRKYTAVLTDPPRKGMSKTLVREILDFSPAVIVYLSCNPATFMRDAKLLIEGGYSLHKIVPFDFFPYTGHIEVLGFFQKKHGFRLG